LHAWNIRLFAYTHLFIIKVFRLTLMTLDGVTAGEVTLIIIMPYLLYR